MNKNLCKRIKIHCDYSDNTINLQRYFMSLNNLKIINNHIH